MLILNGIRHVGPISSSRLLEAFGGDPIAVLSAPRSQLLEVKGVGAKAVDQIRSWPAHFNLAKERELMDRTGIRFLDRFSEQYPEFLTEIYDSPIGLYWKGNYFVDRPCIAIVGTRQATLYGRSVAKKFAQRLAQLGYCIVSGMARGTDTAAHEGALEVGGKTIAVFGCGMDIIYPPENLDLYRAICESGAVVSEFPFGRRADRQTFPMRNRVVSGMCEAVIVVESAESGGSMITARFAGEQGRQVLAIPGRIDQASSGGCHQLIRDGAILVTSVDEVLSELNFGAVPQQAEMSLMEGSKPIGQALGLDEGDQRIVDAFRGGERLCVDQLTDLLEMTPAEVSARLMGLEIRRVVGKLSDGSFELTSH